MGKVESPQKIENLTDAIAETTNPEIRKRYEQKIEALIGQKTSLAQASADQTLEDARNGFRKGRLILENPVEYWKTGGLAHRKLAQEMLLKTPILCEPEKLGRNAEFSFVPTYFRNFFGNVPCGGLDAKNFETLFQRKNWQDFVLEMKRWHTLFNSSKEA